MNVTQKTESRVSARPAGRSRLGAQQRQGCWGFVFALPAVVLFVLFSLFPILRTFYISFFNYDLLTPPHYIGLENFKSLLSDHTFGHSLITTFSYVFGTYIPVLVLALLLALALNTRIRGRGVFRTLYFVPVVMSWVVVSVIWKLIFHRYGLLNASVVRPLGLPPIDWLTSQQAAPVAVILMSIWKELGFYMVVFLAGLQNIPPDYYEAARVDGAGSGQLFRHITLPLLQPTLLFVSIIAMINGLQVLIPQFVMTGGGPVNATQVIALNIYQTAFVFLRMGKAAAMAVELFVIIAIISLLQFRLYRSSAEG